MSLFGAFTKRFALPLWKWYLAGLIALALTNWITLQIPLLAKTIINSLEGSDDLQSLSGIALTIIGLGLLTIIIRALSRIFIFWPGRKVEAASKSYLFNHMMRLPEEFYQRFGMGELISRLSNDIGQLRAFYAFGFLQLANLVFLLAFAISKMLSIHATLTIAALSPLVLMIFFMRPMMNYMHVISKQNQEAVGRLTNKVTEAFVNVHVIKSNSAESTFLDRAEVENEDVYVTNMKSVALRTVFFPLLGSLMNVSQVVVVFYGGSEVIANRLTIGDILAFNVYIAYLGFPLSAFGMIVSLYQRCIASLQRIHTIEVAQKEQAHPEHATKAANSCTILEVRGLDFRYPGSDHNALSNISFKLNAGERLGIFGAIGSGKTTLFNLVTRISNPSPEQIYFKGSDVLAYQPNQLRQDIGYAQQGVHLFSDSVRANLRMGKPEASDEDLKEAAAFAQIDGEIEDFDKGWETEIGEKGLRLSGGQKQRLALARVFLRKPALYLLDDVLSAVDQDTERRLIARIHATDSALIVASHRVSALRQCDKVMVLENGNITDFGTFEEVANRVPVLRGQGATS